MVKSDEDKRISEYIRSELEEQKLAANLLEAFAPYLALTHKPSCDWYLSYSHCNCGLRETLLKSRRWITEFRLSDVVYAISEMLREKPNA